MVVAFAQPSTPAAVPSVAPSVVPSVVRAVPTRSMPPVDGDLVRSYLRDIGRVPLLSHEQEITLG
ncbi:MAG: sigma-70 factor domain-containing protein, partial [Cyanobium sp. CZS 25K]|nr:sigma-70 factor domain-containing protein [Cyanobium sp. CZS25K]